LGRGSQRLHVHRPPRPGEEVLRRDRDEAAAIRRAICWWCRPSATSLPRPGQIAREIAEDLWAALEQSESVAEARG
jgi:hypothetical protein